MEKDGRDSVVARMDQERQKAIEKYGEAGLAPGGNSEYDIIDYAINEIVGLHRYAEMISARVDASAWPVSARVNLRNISQAMREFALQNGHELIAVRNQLLAEEFILGNPEKR